MRLNQFDYFRAIAILIIVAGHCIYDVIKVDTFLEKVLVNLIYGGTALFVFISGFFFHHVFYKKFNYQVFMVKKLQSVVSPYLVMTTIVMVLYLFAHPYLNNWVAKEVAQASVSVYQTIVLYFEYLLFGGISAQFWYIPFIIIIFLLSPMFIGFIKLPHHLQWLTYGILFFNSTLIWRPETHLTPWHHVLYYSPIYLLGIMCSIHRERFLSFIEGKALVFGILALTLAVIQTLMFNVVGHYEKSDPFTYSGFDIMLVQEVMIGFCIMAILQRYENKEIALLKNLAAASFAIYFLHEFVKLVVKGVFVRLNIWDQLNRVPEPVAWIFLVGLVTFLSLFCAWLVKKVLKSQSKYIVGW